MSMSDDDVDLRLAEHPGAHGFYGEAVQGDTVVHLDIMPPAYLWAGGTPRHTDHTHWRVFADGSLLGRIKRQEDVVPALLSLLAARPSAFARACSPTCNPEES
jgi:hypothetical protein